MTKLRRFTQSPRYRALWRRDIDFVSVFGAGFITLLSSGVVHDLIREDAEMWAYPLAMGLIAGASCFLIRRFSIQVSPLETSREDHTKFRLVEDRLDELERLKRRDMVTPEEYVAKRQEILKDL